MGNNSVSRKPLNKALKIWGYSAVLLTLVGCVGQAPNMARMIFPDPEMGATISKSGAFKNEAAYDAAHNTYEFGIYSGTIPRIGVELGSSGLTGRMGITTRHTFGANCWANFAIPWSNEVTGGVALSEKINLNHRWAIGTYQFLSHSSEYPLYEGKLIDLNETFNEIGLGLLLRSVQYSTAIYSLEGRISREIDENNYRFSITANFSLNRKALN